MLEQQEPIILKKLGFPNTYTLTKNLAEQAFKRKRRADLRITISRPAIVSATQKYPFPGWADSIAAGGAVIFSLGMGITNRDLIYDNVVSAVIPCDYVVNTIFVAAAVSAAWPQPGFEVYHGSPSGIFRNYTQREFFATSQSYLTTQPWENAITPPNYYKANKHRRDYLRGIKLDGMIQ